MISVVNYGLGNLGSIVNMLKKIGLESQLVNRPSEILRSERIILPGVGAFDNAVGLLRELQLDEPLISAARNGIPILGVCLGMQLLGTKSEEGTLPGLNLIPGESKKFHLRNDLKVPHMGWNKISLYDNELMVGLEDNRFYFVHSYYFDSEKPCNIAGVTEYGLTFPSVIRSGNIIGVQFHPEKSHRFGMQLLLNFSRVL